MILLALLFLSTANAYLFTFVSQVKTRCWYNPDGCQVEGTGSTCNFCVKNGPYTDTLCKQGMPSYWWQTFYWNDTPTTIQTPLTYQDTIVWTDCDDAMAFPFAMLIAVDGRSKWGEQPTFGKTPMAWCLSTNQSDGTTFEGMIHGNICYRALILKPDGSVWYYLDQSYSPGRRMLDGIPVPTDEEVKDCELDPTRDNEECIALIDQILTYDLLHPENFVEVTDETEEDNTEDDESSTDDVSSENDVSSAETATENSPVSNTLRRLLKA